jgi:hypothetical protein
VSISLEASLIPVDGNYRAAMLRIEHFIRSLQSVPALDEVSLRSSPVNADSSGSLSGRTFNADGADAPAARFTLSLRYREVLP